jgi:hypothetical protein
MPLSKADQFYGSAEGLSLGAGLIVSEVPIPVFLANEVAYGTAKGTVVVLTHECDIDPANIRPFNDYAVVLPIIPLRSMITLLQEQLSDLEIRSFVMSAAGGQMSRLGYLPRFGSLGDPLYAGGIVNYNYMTSCGVAALATGRVVCSLTQYAMGTLDIALQEHLRRPKAEALPQPTGVSFISEQP